MNCKILGLGATEGREDMINALARNWDGIRANGVRAQIL